MIQHLRKFSKDIKSENDFFVKRLQKCTQKPIFDLKYINKKVFYDQNTCNIIFFTYFCTEIRSVSVLEALLLQSTTYCIKIYKYV